MLNKIDIDQANSRIIAYLPDRDETVIRQLAMLQKQYQTSKTICYARRADADVFMHTGFHSEGTITGFFAGETALIYSRLYSNERAQQNDLEKQQEIAKIVEQDNRTMSNRKLPEGVTIEKLKTEDTGELAALYQTVFTKYPSNVFNPAYLQGQINDNYFFVVAKKQGKIVSAASAMINDYSSAEITDCATDPNHRGENLLYPILLELEGMLRAKQISYAYSLTRALSAGMNLTIKRLGYTWEGMLVNNCIISTGFENMNIWTKKLM